MRSELQTKSDQRQQLQNYDGVFQVLHYPRLRGRSVVPRVLKASWWDSCTLSLPRFQMVPLRIFPDPKSLTHQLICPQSWPRHSLYYTQNFGLTHSKLCSDHNHMTSARARAKTESVRFRCLSLYLWRNKQIFFSYGIYLVRNHRTIIEFLKPYFFLILHVYSYIFLYWNITYV